MVRHAFRQLLVFAAILACAGCVQIYKLLSDPLVLAAEDNDDEKVRSLLKAGKNPNDSSLDGEYAILIAARKGKLRLVQLLLEYGADVNTQEYFYTSSGSRIKPSEMTPEMIDAEIKKRGCAIYDGYTVLATAVLHDNDRIVEFLLKKGADPNIATPTGSTPLMHAVSRGNQTNLDLLIKHGANVNAVDKCGSSVLSKTQNRYIAKLLIDAGAKPLF